MAKDRKLYLNERTTIRDVAQEAGVSLTTVSHALNGYKDVSEKTRQKVMEVARRLDYMPDEAGRSLRGIQKKTIALLLAGELPEEDPSGMMYGLTSGIYKIAQKMEYEFTILTMPTNKQIKISFGQICKKKKLTGIIVDGLAMDMPYYEQIKNSEIPCVLVDVALESDHVCEVSVDNEKASFEEVEHLIENGCRNIAMLSGKKTAQVSERRECGYRRALEKYGLHIREEWIEDCLFDQKTAVQKSIELKKSYPEIDAFFCVNDGVAIGAIEGMGQLGVRVPDDVAIAGFDDYTVSQYIHGGITSIKQYPYKMGVACANTVISMIEGNRVPDWIPMEYKLMKRASTKK